MSYEIEPARRRMREQVALLSEVLEQDPSNWWRGSARMLIGFRRAAIQEPDPEIREYLTAYIDRGLGMLRDASSLGNVSHDDVIEQAEHMIMEISMEMASRFEKKDLNLNTHFIPLEDLVNAHPDRLKLEKRRIKNTLCTILNVRHPTDDIWHEIPLPEKAKTWHKGGPARAVMNVLADAPLSMQLSEFPWNDFDVVVAGSSEGIKAAKAIGVDSDGIEFMGEDELNFKRFCYGRDTEQNQTCLGSDGLYYSDGALNSAKTGHVNIVGVYIANKAIYGIDQMKIRGTTLVKQRGLMRLVKTVAEGKALSFDYLPVNSNFDMGVYVLFLAKRWSNKTQFPQLLQRMYYLLNHMGQIRENERDIFDVLERAHAESPFFDFDSEVRFPLEVVRWKSRKLVKQIDRESAWQFRFTSALNLARSTGDDVPQRVSLDGFTYDLESAKYVREKWIKFMEKSRVRTAKQQDIEQSPYDKIFGVSFTETDDQGVDLDDSF